MRRGLILGLGQNQWKATIGHIFPEILNRQGKLQMLASQNIDGIDHKVLSDKRKLFNPHGLMSVLVSEPAGIDMPLCTDPRDPIYQRYVELVKENIRDIYVDKPARQGKSSHLWPGPAASTPITLEMFGDLPEKFGKARALEKNDNTYSVKPGSVLFDQHLWTTTAAGERYDAFDDVSSCDILLVMGTSLSGLTIDNLAHIAGRGRKPRIVFDMTAMPVQNLRWAKDVDCFMQAPIDKSILDILCRLGWMSNLYDFLPEICLNSLKIMKDYMIENMSSEEIGDGMSKIDAAISSEIEREKRFYPDD
jgi:NAD-dependent SIR2 family protein deacetylase